MKRKIAVWLSVLLALSPASQAFGADFSSGAEENGVYEAVQQGDAFFDSGSQEIPVTPVPEPVFEVQDPEIPAEEIPDGQIPEEEVPDAEATDAEVPGTDEPDVEIPDSEVLDGQTPDEDTVSDAEDEEFFAAGDVTPAPENPEGENPDETTGGEEEITDISQYTVTVAASVVYDGTAAVPEVSVSKEEQVLVKDQDYTLEYLNNTTIGTATVKITGINKYEGTIEKNFKIIPAVPKLKSAKSLGYNSVKITWEAVPGADSYIVYYKGNTVKKYTKVKSGIKTLSYVHTSSKLISGKTYTYTVKAVGNGVYGKADSKGKKVKPIPAAPKLGKVKSAAYNQLKITWSKVAGASGYYVYRKTGGKWKRVGKTTGTSLVHKSSTSNPIKTGTTYTYTVKAYRKVGTSNVLGAGNTTGIKGKAVPNKAVLVGVEAGTEVGKINISWKKASGATHYLIYRKDAKGKWQRIATIKGINTLSYTHTSSKKFPVTAGQKYTYTVRSYNSNGKTYGSYDTKGKTITGPTAEDILDANLSRKCKSILNQITTPGMSSYQKLRASWNYLTTGRFGYWSSYPNLSKTGWQKECAMAMLSYGGGNCYGFACAFAALASEIGFSPSVVCGRVSGSRDGASDGLTRHAWVIIGGCYYDPEAQYAGWYRGVYGSGSYDIYHTIQRIVPFR